MLAARFALFLIVITTLVAGGSTRTSITLATSGNSAAFGQSITFTATLTPSSATGTVTFYSGTSVLGIGVLVNGQAALSTILLPPGHPLVRAFYGGDAVYQASTSPALAETVSVTPAGGFGGPGNYTAGGYSQAAAVGDFNNDGIADLAVAADTTGNSPQGSAVIFLGNGDGTFKRPVIYSLPVPVNDVVAADFNGDGNADLAFGPDLVLLGNGDGTFQAKTSAQLVYSLFSLTAADFNGDGKIDLAYPNGQSLAVVLGNGDGTFQPESDYAITAVPYFTFTGNTVVADFNGDGKADVAVAVTGNGAQTANVNVFLGNGDGTFQTPLTVDPGDQPLFLAVGDFNGDGKADLASASSFGSATVLLGNGDGTFQSPLMLGTGWSPSIAVGDFNGDGKADLVLPNRNSGTVTVFLGRGDGTFEAALNYGTANYPDGVTIASFNGDGRSDLALPGYDGSVSVLLGSPAVTPQITLTSSPATSVYGQPVTLTATLTPAPAGGSVMFEDGTILGTVPVVGGTASLTTSMLPAGTQSLTAFYYSATQNSASQILTQTVSQAATTTVLTSSANPVTYLQPLTLTARVTPATATGTMAFYTGEFPLATLPLVNGTATFNVSPSLEEDSDSITITAYYRGDSNYLPSTSQNLTEVINPTPTTIALTSSSNPSNLYQNVTLTATVSPVVPGGTITFSDGSTTLGTSGALGGTGSLVVSTLSPGAHSLTASYAGIGSEYAASTSLPLSQTVNSQPASAPVIQARGVVSAANPLGGVAPGTWTAIYGSNLSTTTRTWTQTDFIGNNLPTSLDGVSVTINGKPAYVYYISPSQLNVLAPKDITARGEVPVQVQNSGVFSTPATVSESEIAPAFFTYSQNPKYAIAEDAATYALLGPSGLLGSGGTTRPAAAGEVVALYATGLGDTNPPYPDGQIIQTPLPALLNPQLRIGGVPATVTYVGLVEAGVYQINVVVPQIPSGDALLVLSNQGVQVPGQFFLSIQ